MTSGLGGDGPGSLRVGGDGPGEVSVAAVEFVLHVRFLSVDVIPSEARDRASKSGDATRQILRPSGLRMTSVWGATGLDHFGLGATGLEKYGLPRLSLFYM